MSKKNYSLASFILVDTNPWIQAFKPQINDEPTRQWLFPGCLAVSIIHTHSQSVPLFTISFLGWGRVNLLFLLVKTNSIQGCGESHATCSVICSTKKTSFNLFYDQYCMTLFTAYIQVIYTVLVPFVTFCRTTLGPENCCSFIKGSSFVKLIWHLIPDFSRNVGKCSKKISYCLKFTLVERK